MSIIITMIVTLLGYWLYYKIDIFSDDERFCRLRDSKGATQELCELYKNVLQAIFYKAKYRSEAKP